MKDEVSEIPETNSQLRENLGHKALVKYESFANFSTRLRYDFISDAKYDEILSYSW